MPPLTAGCHQQGTWLSDGARAAGMDWAVAGAVDFEPAQRRLLPAHPVARPGCAGRPPAWPEEHIAARGWRETAWLLLLPPLATAAATLATGILADSGFSPLAWAKLIAAREYFQTTP
ncbi:MAG: hypothetical protein MZW92_52945 [Comamonadaceae bacterium]|nr:hypothetical protein [Comamonadaceae bacterium]